MHSWNPKLIRKKSIIMPITNQVSCNGEKVVRGGSDVSAQEKKQLEVNMHLLLRENPNKDFGKL